MSQSQDFEEQILFEQSLSQQQNLKNNVEVTIVAPFLESQHQSIPSQENQQQKQLIKSEKNQEPIQNNDKEIVDAIKNQQIVDHGHNVLNAHINYRQLSSSDSNHTENNRTNKLQLNFSSQQSNQQIHKQKSFPSYQFNRSEINNHRRSLHVISKQNDEDNNQKNKNQDLSFIRKNKRIISQQNTYRRYPQEDKSNSQSQNDDNNQQILPNQTTKNRRTNFTSMNNTLFGRKSFAKRHQQQSLSKLEQQELFNHPQRNWQRVVVFLKTYILSLFQSVSIQVSLLKKSLVIVANLMGQENQTIQMVLTPQRTEFLFHESKNDWQILGNRIFLEMTSSGGKRIKISPMQQMIDFAKIDSTNVNFELNKGQFSNYYMMKMKENKRRQIYLRQKSFIQRNYYSIINKNQGKPIIMNQVGQKDSNRSTINSNQKHISTIQTKKVETKISFGLKNPRKISYFNHTKHLDYMSPQIKQKIRQFQSKKGGQLSSQQVSQEKLQLIQHQKIERQAFIKKQHAFIERLSKSKNNQEAKTENKKQKSQSKDKPFVVLKVESVNNLAYFQIANQRKSVIETKQLENEKHIEVAKAENVEAKDLKQQVYEGQSEKILMVDEATQEFKIKRTQSEDKQLNQFDNQKNEIQMKQDQQILQSQARITDINDFENSLVQIISNEKQETDEEKKNTQKFEDEEDQYKFESSNENNEEKYENQYDDEFQSNHNKSRLKNSQNIINLSQNKVSQSESNKYNESQNEYNDLIRDADDDEYEVQYEEFQEEKSHVFTQKNHSSLKSNNQIIDKAQKQIIAKNSQYSESFEHDFQQEIQQQQNIQEVEEYEFSQLNENDNQRQNLQSQEENYLNESFTE